MMDADYVYKIIVLGDAGVGKSSLLRRIHDNTFDKRLPTTVGVDFFIQDLEINGKIVKLQLWDTGGEERHRSLMPNYFRHADGVMMVFDMTDDKSLINLRDYWTKEFYAHASRSSGDIVAILVGNKCDLTEERRVTEDDIKTCTQWNSMCWLETSAKDNTNVQEAFNTIAERLVDNSEQLQSLESMRSMPGTFTLHGAYGVRDPEETGWVGSCCQWS